MGEVLITSSSGLSLVDRRALGDGDEDEDEEWRGIPDGSIKAGTNNGEFQCLWSRRSFLLAKLGKVVEWS